MNILPNPYYSAEVCVCCEYSYIAVCVAFKTREEETKKKKRPQQLQQCQMAGHCSQLARDYGERVTTIDLLQYGRQVARSRTGTACANLAWKLASCASRIPPVCSARETSELSGETIKVSNVSQRPKILQKNFFMVWFYDFCFKGKLIIFYRIFGL